jgi:hypothetical protein
MPRALDRSGPIVTAQNQRDREDREPDGRDRSRGRETWYVGEKVICVNNGFLDLADAPELTESAIYTIADIWPERRGHLGLELAEVDAKAVFVAFDERRFRPLLES